MRTFILVACILLLWSCSSKSQDQPRAPKQLNPGNISKYLCATDSSISYYLYLPKNFVKDNDYPVLVVLDPKARGKMTCEMISGFAETYGYILVCSNNNKNGIEFLEQKEIYTKLLDDLKDYIYSSYKRLYIAGFSGGARVAQKLASQNKEISGIACFGSGASEGIYRENDFAYLSVCGKWDFNYYEVKETEYRFSKEPFAAYFLFFDGKHEWAPQNILENIFLYFETDAMRKGTIKKNQKIIEYIENKVNPTVDLSYINGLNLDDPVVVSFDALLYDSKKEQFNSEKKELQKYLSSFGNSDKDWWKEELTKVRIIIEENLKDDEWYAAKRVFASLSLYSYMYAVKALNDGYANEADLFTFIYSIVDPDNPDYNYLKARIAIAGNQPEIASQEMKIALDKGFDDYEKIEKDKFFKKLTPNSFSSIISEIMKKY